MVSLIHHVHRYERETVCIDITYIPPHIRNSLRENAIGKPNGISSTQSKQRELRDCMETGRFLSGVEAVGEGGRDPCSNHTHTHTF